MLCVVLCMCVYVDVNLTSIKTKDKQNYYVILESEMVDAKQLLQKSWFDSAWTPILNQNNVMDYFCQRSNPFYERTCNNEIIRMQRGDPAQLV